MVSGGAVKLSEGRLVKLQDFFSLVGVESGQKLALKHALKSRWLQIFLKQSQDLSAVLGTCASETVFDHLLDGHFKRKRLKKFVGVRGLPNLVDDFFGGCLSNDANLGL